MDFFFNTKQILTEFNVFCRHDFESTFNVHNSELLMINSNSHFSNCSLNNLKILVSHRNTPKYEIALFSTLFNIKSIFYLSDSVVEVEILREKIMKDV